ncbi:hypothetical protein SUNI508_12702 [Seiridium unicorne]|uniref:Uncharacterized protein n=1 Tax=Seiridium unicorne TaxID=138068 RepID=A0ABR2VGE1_9PEZI
MRLHGTGTEGAYGLAGFGSITAESEASSHLLTCRPGELDRYKMEARPCFSTCTGDKAEQQIDSTVRVPLMSSSACNVSHTYYQSSQAQEGASASDKPPLECSKGRWHLCRVVNGSALPNIRCKSCGDEAITLDMSQEPKPSGDAFLSHSSLVARDSQISFGKAIRA